MTKRVVLPALLDSSPNPGAMESRPLRDVHRLLKEKHRGSCSQQSGNIWSSRASGASQPPIYFTAWDMFDDNEHGALLEHWRAWQLRHVLCAGGGAAAVEQPHMHLKNSADPSVHRFVAVGIDVLEAAGFAVGRRHVCSAKGEKLRISHGERRDTKRNAPRDSKLLRKAAHIAVAGAAPTSTAPFAAEGCGHSDGGTQSSRKEGKPPPSAETPSFLVDPCSSHFLRATATFSIRLDRFYLWLFGPGIMKGT